MTANNCWRICPLCFKKLNPVGENGVQPQESWAGGRPNQNILLFAAFVNRFSVNGAAVPVDYDRASYKPPGDD